MDDRVTTLLFPPDTVEEKEIYFAGISPCIPHHHHLINFPSQKNQKKDLRCTSFKNAPLSLDSPLLVGSEKKEKKSFFFSPLSLSFFAAAATGGRREGKGRKREKIV